VTTIPRSTAVRWAAGSVVIPFTARGWWNTAHGVVLGALYLVTLVLALVAVLLARETDLTAVGFASSLRQVRYGVVAAAALGWVTVVSGTWGIYPWFRAASPDSPRSLLLARASLAIWADWLVVSKEWVAWASVVLVTAAAIAGYRWRRRLESDAGARRRVAGLLGTALLCAGYAAAIGTLLAKLAPVR
jgi:hypothetical protein